MPVVGLLYGGISLLFDVKGPRWLGWILAPLWILSIVVLTVIGIHIGNDFRVTEELNEEVTLAQPTGKLINLRAIERSPPGPFTQWASLRLERPRSGWRPNAAGLEQGGCGAQP